MDRISSPPRAVRQNRPRLFALLAYSVGLLILLLALGLRHRPGRDPIHSITRAQERGELGPDLPRLGADDPMANAAVLNAALAKVPHPGLAAPDEKQRSCSARARNFAIYVDGKLSRIRFGGRTVCQLQYLKEISMAQPGFPAHGLAEVAAFVLGRRLPGASDVDVTRLLVPPFRFAGDSLTFAAADLGPLGPGEQLIGTYHTHPEDDLAQGVLSETDLEYFHSGIVDFAGQVGPLGQPSPQVDWLFDIVDPRDGSWNVYAHDGRRLAALRDRCSHETPCPLNELRLAGSPYNLLARVYEERDDYLP